MAAVLGGVFGAARALGAPPSALAGLLTGGVLADPPSKSALDKQISAASDQLELVVEQYDAAGVELAATKSQAAAVSKALVPLQDAQAAAQAKVGQMATDVYQTATPAGVLGQLLEAPSIDVLGDQLSNIEQVASMQRQLIATLNSATSRYNAQADRLAVLVDTENKEHALLAAKKATIQQQISQLTSLRQAAYGPTGQASEAVIHFVPNFTSDAAGKAVKYAYDQLGKGYRFGAAGPDYFDCSGLTMMAWRAGGVSLPHSAAQQYQVIPHVTRANLRAGDLVFYYSPIHHVGIYVGDNYVINAPTYGEPVKISPITLAPIAGYGRP